MASDCSSTEVALTDSERCLAAILSASTREDSPDRMRTAVERAIDTFKDSASRIESMCARRGAVADLAALIDRCRRGVGMHAQKQNSLRLRALDLADPLIREIGRSFRRDDTPLAPGARKGQQQSWREDRHTLIERLIPKSHVG